MFHDVVSSCINCYIIDEGLTRSNSPIKEENKPGGRAAVKKPNLVMCKVWGCSFLKMSERVGIPYENV